MTIFACEKEPVKVVFETGTISDIDGNIYNTIKIGEQWWMAENLNVSKFNDGTEIPLIESNESWEKTQGAGYCNYDNKEQNSGKLYNYHVVNNPMEIAPDGWRVPSDDDWKALESYLGMPGSELDKINWRGQSEGDLLKIKGNLEWIKFGEIWGTDSFGFSAEAGSCRFYDGSFGIPELNKSGFWWTKTEVNNNAWFRYLDYQKSGIFRYAENKNYGFSIRCIKN